MRTITDDTATHTAVLDATQPCDCAESSEVRMRQADAVRSAFYADVCRGVAAMAGEVEL